MSISVMVIEYFIASAVPNLSASQPSLTDGNNNMVNTPPATGLLVPPQSPAGVIITNTGRTAMATQTAIAHSFNQVQQGVLALTNVAAVTLAGTWWPPYPNIINASNAGFVPSWPGYGSAGTKFS